MPSNSTDFNLILNIQNVIKDTSPSQEYPQSSSTPAKTLEMSSIFERVLDAFKLIRFQPNFKHNSLRAFAGRVGWLKRTFSKMDYISGDYAGIDDYCGCS